MKNRFGGGALLGAAALVSAWFAWPQPPATGQPGRPESIPPPHTVKYFGVASCSAMACHNGNGPEGSERSEFSTWASSDQHAKAYAVLENERSKRIVKNYYYRENKPEAVPATERELCLKCHATFAAKGEAGERYQAADGVGCESCHGASHKYLSTHYTAEFLALSAEEKEKRYGLRNTKDLAVRAKLCSTCHVGDESKEVNHDLIAAGHPRLSFELGGYHGIAHKHWREKGVNARADFQERLWQVGQLTSAKAALDLLAVRAESADKAGAANRPWPEFAEYECYACHRDIKVDSPTQKSDYYKQRYPGSFPYGSWYLTMVPDCAGTLGADGALAKELKAVRTEMEKPAPDAKKVAAAARAASKRLDALIRGADRERAIAAPKLRQHFTRFLDDGIKRGTTLSWDEATQLYLALAAAHQALYDSRDPQFRDGKLMPAMVRVKDRLRNAFPPGTDSPGKYDPSALANQLKALRGQLGQ